jgi:hypothetical protein
MTTLQDLLANHPLAVEAIVKWNAGIHLDRYDDKDAADRVHLFAALNKIGTPYLDSIETLLGLIEAKCKAEAPLTDEDINAMLWEPEELYDDRASNTRWHNACIDKLHAEIKRMRKEADRG